MEINKTNSNEALLFASLQERVPCSMQPSSQEYREGYVRGFSECATTLMEICETMFADTVGLQYVRARLVNKIEDAAIKLDRITEKRRDSFLFSYEE